MTIASSAPTTAAAVLMAPSADPKASTATAATTELIDDVRRQRMVQHRDREIARMHIRRAENLHRQIAVRERRLQPLVARLDAIKEALRDALVLADTDADRDAARAALAAFKQAARLADRRASAANASFARFVERFDSDSDMGDEHPMPRGRMGAKGKRARAAATTAGDGGGGEATAAAVAGEASTEAVAGEEASPMMAEAE